MSTANRLRYQEHPYGICKANLIRYSDNDGCQVLDNLRHVTRNERPVMAKRSAKIAILDCPSAAAKDLFNIAMCYYSASRFQDGFVNNIGEYHPFQNRNPSRENALRHCNWQCCLVKVAGIQLAAALANAHEDGSRGGRADNTADNINNRIGRSFGLNKEDCCMSSCLSAWNRGGLADRDTLMQERFGLE